MTLHRRPAVWHIGGEDVRLRIPLLLALRERGFDVGAAGSEDGAPFVAADIPYRWYPLSRWIDPLGDWRSVRELARLLRDASPDVVHAFDTKPGVLLPGAARRAGVPVRLRTITGMGEIFSSQSLRNRLLRPVYRRYQRRAARDTSWTVFQNPDDQEYFRQQGLVPHGQDSVVLGSGVTLEDVELNEQVRQRLREEVGGDGKYIVTMVARLVRNKGVLEFLEAARRVMGRLREARFVLVGPRASEGRQAVAAEVLASYRGEVNYLGRRDDIKELLRASDLFVLPTYYREGVPRVLLEAATARLPIVTTDMPGCREVVRDGWNGWLVPPRDAAALADTIVAALGLDRGARSAMGLRGRDHVASHFGLDQVADAYAALYRDLLRDANPGLS